MGFFWGGGRERERGGAGGHRELHVTGISNTVLCSFQGSPCEDRNFRSDVDDTEAEEASFSGQDDCNDLSDILEWAKVSFFLGLLTKMLG